MAIGVTEPVAELASTSNATSYALGAFTPAANAVLLVLVFATGTVAAGTMTGGSLTWTRKTSILYNATDTAYVFWAKTGGSPASATITFDCTGDTATGCVMMAFQHTGANDSLADPIRQVKAAATTGANPTITFDAPMRTLNGYCAGFGMPRNPPTSAAPASWTETADAGYNTPASGASGAFRAGGETGSTITFTSASAAYGMLACEVYEASQGPATLPVIWKPGDAPAAEAFARVGPATYEDVNRVVQSAATQVRRDAAYIGGVGPGLLVESRRVNLLLESQQLDVIGGNWLGHANVTITLNFATGPGGAATADRVQVTVGGGHNFRQDILAGYVPGNVVQFAFDAKNNGGSVAALSVYDATNLAEIIAPTSYFSQLSGSEYRRIVVSFTVPAGCTNFAVYLVRDSGSGVDLVADEVQVEVGAFATSRIRTTAAGSVAREADLCDIAIAPGVAATRYVKYIDLNGGALVESVSAITTTPALPFEPDRLWLRNAVDAGTKTLAAMQALYPVAFPFPRQDRRIVPLL